MDAIPPHAATGTERTGRPLTWVMVETAPWGHRLRLPGHHLAEYLADRGHRVAYLSAPVSPWHFLSPSRREDARRRWTQEGPRGQWRTPNLFTCIPRTLLPVHSSKVLDTELSWRLSARLTVPSLRRLLQREGFGEPDVLMMHNLQLPGLAELLPHRCLVLRVEDDIAGFPAMPSTIIRNEPAMIRQADVVTTTALSLNEKVRDARGGDTGLVHMPNGARVGLFRRKDQPTRIEPRAERVAVYTGALDSWFDDELLAAVADRLPGWRFDLIGKPARAFPLLQACRNVRFPGPMPQEDLPPVLWNADAAIIPFRRIPLIESVCPLKLFEYLAAEVPVVSTRWRELELLNPPATLVSSVEEFATAIESAPQVSVEKRRTAARWAAQYDWPLLFPRLLDAVYTHLDAAR